MLAQNFKTATDLGIEEVELEALVKVLGMLERGEIKREQFDMYQIKHKCGTPSCILGWANFVSNGDAFPLAHRPLMVGLGPDWNRLSKEAKVIFSFADCAPNADKAKPDQAAIALRNYLTSGEANWAEATRE